MLGEIFCRRTKIEKKEEEMFGELSDCDRAVGGLLEQRRCDTAVTRPPGGFGQRTCDHGSFLLVLGGCQTLFDLRSRDADAVLT